MTYATAQFRIYPLDISIHMLRAEHDAFAVTIVVMIVDFNPHAPCGS